jgi:hypothetical protein
MFIPLPFSEAGFGRQADKTSSPSKGRMTTLAVNLLNDIRVAIRKTPPDELKAAPGRTVLSLGLE